MFFPCVLCLTNIGFLQCFSFGSLWKLFLFFFLYACFALRTSVLCGAIPSVPFSLNALLYSVMF